MEPTREWETHVLPCPEGEDHTATLRVEREIEDGKPVIKSVSCDNPKFHDMNHANWDCRWSCWEKLAKEIEEG
jgi:hypothetical protein